MDHLYAEHPEPASITHSLRTPDGGGWWPRCLSSRPHIRERGQRQTSAGRDLEGGVGLVMKIGFSGTTTAWRWYPRRAGLARGTRGCQTMLLPRSFNKLQPKLSHLPRSGPA